LELLNERFWFNDRIQLKNYPADYLNSALDYFLGSKSIWSRCNKRKTELEKISCLPEKADAYKNLSGKDYLKIYGWFLLQ